jgi:metal-responsive CopG/Arc/MetJ family transcriptional regulator
MSAKTIQMTIDEGLLVDVDAVVRSLGTSRSAFIRNALEAALRSYRIQKMDERHERGYRLHPVQPGEFDELQAEQAWGGE